ncbi:MAG: TRAP transporter small permease subunit [Variibacter sp.]
MPSLTFVLPHWLYWGTLIVFPLVAFYFVARQRRRHPERRASLFLAYLFWVTAGMMGVHRLYLRSYWGLIFLPVFLAILHVNDGIRDRREDVSRTKAAHDSAHTLVERARPLPNMPTPPQVQAKFEQAQATETKTKAEFDAATAALADERRISLWLALLLAAMLLVDAVLLPMEVRRANRREAAKLASAPPDLVPPDVAQAGTHEDPTLGLHTRFTDMIDRVTGLVGEYVAYWAVISVFVYYYEVIARFVFNSPTNWVHESMFLMYGMQYMLAGAYAYREDQHVRVDVIYTMFSPRGKAIADIVTSVFFFIFVLTMLWTGANFALDSINYKEVSFTEWAVQYWPVKLAIPIGAALLALQGLSKLIKDIVFISRGNVSHGH